VILEMYREFREENLKRSAERKFNRENPPAKPERKVKPPKPQYDHKAYWENQRAKARNYNRRKLGVIPTRPEPAHCELCGKTPSKKALCLDHCHTKKMFRGWLCGHCNIGLGMFKDNADVLRRAITYLENKLV
jgi:recombination endonuclease VII